MRDNNRRGGVPPAPSRSRSPLPNLPPHQVPSPGIAYTTPAPATAMVPSDTRVSGVIPARLLDEFISRLPPKGYIPWYRKMSIAGTDVTGLLPGETLQLTLDDVSTRTTRLVFWMSYFWMDAGLDPLDPDALTAFQDNQNIYGRIPFNLLVNNAPIVDVSETVFDPGIAGTRSISGYTLLNENLLATGNHPTALYISENQVLAGAFQHVATPGHIPTAIGAELRGYSIPTRDFEKVMKAIRSR